MYSVVSLLSWISKTYLHTFIPSSSSSAARPRARLFHRVDGGSGGGSDGSKKPPFFCCLFCVCVPYGFILANRRAVTDGTDGDAKGKLNQPHGNQHEIERKRKPETVHDLRVKSRHGQDEDCEIEHRSLFIDGV